MKKVLRYTAWGLFAIVVILWGLFRFGINMEMDAAEVAAFARNNPVAPEFHRYAYGDQEIHYVGQGPRNRPTLLFIHGSPGSWDAYARYFSDSSLYKHYRLISVDRLGYGQTTPGQPEPDLALQAEVFRPLLETIPLDQALIVVGHSYGGPVAVRMAMDYPDRIDGLLLVAGIADPDREKRFWVQPLLQYPAFRWLLPPSMDVSNREIVPLKQELTEILDRWDQIRAETIVIQGGEDSLVDPANADFTLNKLSHIPASLVWLPGEDHFLIWTHYLLIKSAIQDLSACVRRNF